MEERGIGVCGRVGWRRGDRCVCGGVGVERVCRYVCGGVGVEERV